MNVIRIRRVGVLSVAKVLGLLYALLGLILGALFTCISVMGVAASFSEASGGDQVMGLIFGAGAIILMPLFYGIMGFIGGLIMGAFYNLVAGFVGGIELETE